MHTGVPWVTGVKTIFTENCPTGGMAQVVELLVDGCIHLSSQRSRV